MAILSAHVERYLEDLRPPRSALMAEMEALAERDGVPIVHWETGRFLAALVRALEPARVLEVGTAIGYSTLHMAEAATDGRVVTLERDPERAAQASEFLARAGVDERVELVQGDALEAIPSLTGPFDVVFLDATKAEVPAYLERVEPLVTPRCVLVIDNLLMGGEAALGDDDETTWAPESLAAGRAAARELLRSDAWLGVVLPVGDGIGFAARRA